MSLEMRTGTRPVPNTVEFAGTGKEYSILGWLGPFWAYRCHGEPPGIHYHMFGTGRREYDGTGAVGAFFF